MHHARLPDWDARTVEQKLELLKEQVDNLYGYLFQPARLNLRALLEAHHAADESEVRSVTQIQAMLDEYPSLLSPICEVGHITGSALVIHPDSQRILLLYHAKLQRWLQMGGHPEYEVDPAQTALREAREESGLTDLRFYPDLVGRPLDIDVHRIPARHDVPEHDHLDIRYLLATDTPDAIRINTGESHDLRWFRFDELATLNLDSSLLRLIEKSKNILNA